uniref:Uncharacterized protein n=1 Tax=Chrysemys picta bellii TaxID=8478 RepID=A0A8C3I4G4_CHRPI
AGTVSPCVSVQRPAQRGPDLSWGRDCLSLSVCATSRYYNNCALGCILKQPDSEKTRSRRAGGRYWPHTIHGHLLTVSHPLELALELSLVFASCLDFAHFAGEERRAGGTWPVGGKAWNIFCCSWQKSIHP